MPFIRKGLCRTDKIKCAKMLAADIGPKDIAVKLSTTVDVVKRFTQKALDKIDARNTKRKIASEKHVKETKETAAAIAGAAKEILHGEPDGDLSL